MTPTPSHDAPSGARSTLPSAPLLRTALLLSAFVVTGCGDQGEAGIERTTDENGSEVVTVLLTADDYGPIGTVAAEPDLQLSSMTADPVDIFGSVRGIRAFPDGEIVVAEGQETRLAFFAPDGTPLRTIGGRGEAPGQFRTLTQIAMVNQDSLWVWDQQAMRITVFERNGTVARLMRFVAPEPDRQYSRAFVLPDRTFLTVSDGRIAPPPAQMQTGHAFERDTVVVHRRGALGDFASQVVAFPGGENLRVWQSPQPNMMMSMVAPLPFRRTGAYTVLADEWIVGGPNDRFVIHWWGLDGTLRRVTRFPALDRALTPEDVGALRAEWIADAEDSPPRIELVDLAFNEAPIPETFPAFSQILSGGDGGVWVREHDPTGTAVPRWWRFDPTDGTPSGYVDFPQGVDVHEIGSDYVLGVWRDQTALQHVRRYALELP